MCTTEWDQNISIFRLMHPEGRYCPMRGGQKILIFMIVTLLIGGDLPVEYKLILLVKT